MSNTVKQDDRTGWHYYIEMKILVPHRLSVAEANRLSGSMVNHVHQLLDGQIVRWNSGESPCCMEPIERAKWQAKRQKRPCVAEGDLPPVACSKLFE